MVQNEGILVLPVRMVRGKTGLAKRGSPRYWLGSVVEVIYPTDRLEIFDGHHELEQFLAELAWPVSAADILRVAGTMPGGNLRWIDVAQQGEVKTILLVDEYFDLGGRKIHWSRLNWDNLRSGF